MNRYTPLLLPLVLLVICCGVSAAWTGTTIIDETREQAPEEPQLQADSYAVQVGRFRDEAKALELAQELRQKGYSPHVLSAREAGGEVWHAVRLLLFDTLQDAREAARQFSEKESLQAMVAISGSTSPVPSTATIYFLQTGAFQEQANAMQSARDFAEKGYDSGIVKLYDTNHKLWRIVHVGAYESFDQARQVATEFRKKSGQKCYINAIDPQLFQERQEPLE